MGVLGDIIYRGASVWNKLAGNITSSRKFLSQTGTGAVSAIPSWQRIIESDIDLTNITTNNVTSTAHGFAPVSPADATQFLNGGATPGWTVPSAANITGSFAWGGDGSDLALVYDGTTTILGMAPVLGVYTLTRDICATSITISATDGSGHTVTIITNNFAIYCSGTLTNNGTIQNDGSVGNAGTNAVSSAAVSGGGLRAAAGSSTGHYTRLNSSIAGTNSGAGGTGAGSQAPVANSGNNASNAIDGSGTTASAGAAGGVGGSGTSGAGGALRSGGAAGSISLVSPYLGRAAFVANHAAGWNSTTNVFTPYTTQNPGNGGAAGGSGGGGDGANSGGGGGAGGGEGGSGGVIGIFAKVLINNGTISSVGGTGGKGGNGFTPTLGNTGGGGGGGAGSGGKGGIIFLVYQSYTASGTVTVAGGSAGAVGTKGSPHGTGTDNAANGATGSSGMAGIAITIQC